MKESDLFREPGTLETDDITVRSLTLEDLDRVVRIDESYSGRRRAEFYGRKLDEVTRESGLMISLAAELDGMLVGFLLGRLYYGEFGVPEPVAIVDALGVDPEFTGRKVGAALAEQLVRNMQSLGVETIRTEVAWDAVGLLGFFARQGFAPAPRLCLEKLL